MRVSAHKRPGMTTVEFALAVSLLFFVVFCTIEYSRVSILRHAVDSAAYEGARNVIAPGANVQEGMDRENALLAAAGLSGATVTVEPNPILEESTTVRVNVTLPVDANSWLVRMFGGHNVASSCQFMTERPALVQAESFVLPPPPPPPPAPEPEPESDDESDDESDAEPPPPTPTLPDPEPAPQPQPPPVAL